MNEQFPIRILQCTSELTVGGVQRFLIKYGEKLLSKGIIFDYIVQTDEEQTFDRKVTDEGSIIYHVTSLSKSVIRYMIDVYKILRKHPEYQIIHAHLNFASIAALIAAKLAGVRVRICHSHSNYEASGFKSRVARCVFRKIYPIFVTDCWACSQNAANWLYGSKCKNVSVICNAVDTNLYKYNDQTRIRFRHKLSIVDKTVWIHVGMFGKAKNHVFLLEVFSEFVKENPNSVLLLCGSGEEQEIIHQKINDLRIREKVMELGMVHNVQDYYMAADLMVFPSLCEGLPFVIVEAQISGLPCVVSEAVPEEICFDGVQKVLNWDVNNWLDEVNASLKKSFDRQNAWKIIRQRGYDIDMEADTLGKKYLKMYQK